MKSKNMMCANLFFLLKITLTIACLLCSYINFRIVCSISVKNVIRILIEIALNLYTALGNINNINSSNPWAWSIHWYKCGAKILFVILLIVFWLFCSFPLFHFSSAPFFPGWLMTFYNLSFRFFSHYLFGIYHGRYGRYPKYEFTYNILCT